MIYSALCHRSLVHTTSQITSTKALGSHLTRLRQVLYVATNLTHARAYGALRSSLPTFRRAKNIADLDQKALDPIPSASKGPRRSILSLDDLQAVNPNPTISVTSASEELTTPPAIVSKSKPKKNSAGKSKDKGKDKEAAKTSSQVSDEAIPVAAVVVPELKKRVTPLRKQILELEATYPDCVLLVRVGEFYEVQRNECLFFFGPHQKLILNRYLPSNY